MRAPGDIGLLDWVNRFLGSHSGHYQGEQQRIWVNPGTLEPPDTPTKPHNPVFNQTQETGPFIAEATRSTSHFILLVVGIIGIP
jgi:hypothetical protein